MVTRDDVYCLVRSRPNVNVVRDMVAKKLTAEAVEKNLVAVYFEEPNQLDAITKYCNDHGLMMRV